MEDDPEESQPQMEDNKKQKMTQMKEDNPKKNSEELNFSSE